jgi:RNA polymerase sigma-70 factor (ECF subfamily)
MDSPPASAPRELSDAEAVARCLARRDQPDHAAFRALYERHAPQVLAFLERLLGDAAAAEDALQETFVRLYRGLEGYDPARPLAPYVFRIARNAAIDVLRAQKSERAAAPPPPAPAPSALESALATEQGALVEQALAALAPEHRAVVVLRLLHGLKVEAVAEALSCSERTARNRLRAASVLLERELRKRDLII